jgi:hypothetical protein
LRARFPALKVVVSIAFRALSSVTKKHNIIGGAIEMNSFTPDRKTVFGAALFLSAFAAPAVAETIEGAYAVEGSSPGNSSHYRGEALVKRTGDTYSVAWKVGAQRFVGTGVIHGHVFSIVFRAGHVNDLPGIASFEIDGDKLRGGVWAELGSTRTGLETWTPIPP